MDFIDRVSAYPGRYVMTDENGRASHVVLERADEPIVPGTPLNAETFNQMVASFAPGGYGLGTSSTQITYDDLDNTVANGLYYFTKTTAIAGVEASYWCMRVFNYGLGTKTCTQEIYPISKDGYCKIIRTKRDGTWQRLDEAEVVNPPLKLGVEYRTTERFNEKPVYAKALDFGAGAKGLKEVKISTEFVDRLVRVEGDWDSGAGLRELFTHASFVEDFNVIDKDDGSYLAVRMDAGTDSVAPGHTGYPVVYYTKS